MGRSPCCEKAHTNKGAWTKDEDHRLADYIRRHGEGCWRSLPKSAGLLRCGKSCRLRWINYLRPDLKRGNFSDQEDDLIIKLHALLGNKWSLIAGRLPGRTDNEIKNYWNTHIKRKLIGRGVDPQTHRPIRDPASAAAVKTAQLDFRSAAGAPPATEIDLMAKKPKWVESDSGEDVNCSSSGMTTDEEPPPPAPAPEQRSQGPEPELNLELSIGLAGSRPSGSNRVDAAESKRRTELAGVAAEAVCLCCRLGLRGGEMCRNCGGRNGVLQILQL